MDLIPKKTSNYMKNNNKIDMPDLDLTIPHYDCTTDDASTISAETVIDDQIIESGIEIEIENSENYRFI